MLLKTHSRRVVGGVALLFVMAVSSRLGRQDGFSLVFGYLNRNYEDEPEIPIGPNNNIEPGGPDRGQPTHFYPRRQQFMFKVQVPADFGKKDLVWTLTHNGRTDKAFGSLLLVEEIGELVMKENRGGLTADGPNQPPTIVIDGPPQ